MRKFKRNKEKNNVDEVYEFFANPSSSDKKRTYEKALRLAQKDQMAILKKAKLLKS